MFEIKVVDKVFHLRWRVATPSRNRIQIGQNWTRKALALAQVSNCAPNNISWIMSESFGETPPPCRAPPVTHSQRLVIWTLWSTIPVKFRG